jgi:hypothetical protein
MFNRRHGIFSSQNRIKLYEWVFVDEYSSDPGFQDSLDYTGNASGGDIIGMKNELTQEYPPGDYIGFYAVYFDTSTDLYYLFESLEV